MELRKLKLHGVLMAGLLLASTQVLAFSTGSVITGKVVRVADGDTVTLLLADKTQQRIRLAEIDAPESKQPFGRQSTRALIRMCAQRTAAVHVQGRDRYDRVIGRVICDGVDTTEEQVRTGMAWVYDNYVRDRQLYRLQEEARASRAGLWHDKQPIPPWEWRKGDRGQGGSPKPDALVYGNPNSMIYHVRGRCPGYDAMNPANADTYDSEAAAQAAGYRKARNCR